MALPADHAHFAPLAGAEFIVLTTYRRSGVGVPTPVWFAHEDGVLYVTTGADAGKVKRLRANPVMQVAASDGTAGASTPMACRIRRSGRHSADTPRIQMTI